MLLLSTPSRLHAQARLDGTDAVDWYPVHFDVLASVGGNAEIGAVRVFSREVEQVDAGEDGEEAAEKGDGVDGVGGVEAAEEDEGCAEGAGGEGYVVEGVDAAISLSAYWMKGCGGG